MKEILIKYEYEYSLTRPLKETEIISVEEDEDYISQIILLANNFYNNEFSLLEFWTINDICRRGVCFYSHVHVADNDVKFLNENNFSWNLKFIMDGDYMKVCIVFVNKEDLALYKLLK
jgi:hypothetical protein